MSRTLILPVLLVAGLLIAACAPAGGESTQRSARGPITYAEIQEAGITSNAYDVVQRLRPEWLRTRGSGDIRVYVDNSRFGNTVRSLTNISVANIRRMERLDAAQATTRFGGGAGGNLSGAIVIESR